MSEEERAPQLETDRLTLRGLTPDDAETVFPHFADEEVLTYMDSEKAESIEDVMEIINWGAKLARNSAGAHWGLFSKGENFFLGSVNFVARWDNNFARTVHRCEIGYDLTPAYWGNGYMTEAVRRVIDFIYGSTEINRIEATVHPENIRSLNLLSRLGFVREATLRQYIRWNGEYWDMVLLSMLKRDWMG